MKVRSEDCVGQVLSLQPAGRKGEGFAQAQVIAEVSLLPAGPNQAATGTLSIIHASDFLHALLQLRICDGRSKSGML